MSTLLGPASSLMASLNINPNAHVTSKLFGMTIDLDVIWATGMAGLIVVGLGLLVRRNLTTGVPGKFQLAYESLVTAIQDQVRSAIGERGASIVPLAMTLFTFILIANWLDALPGGHEPGLFPSPTGDVNLDYAMALFVIVGVHIASIRHKGLRGYLRHYAQPFAFLVPINMIEELVKPLTLALRLFGNIFSGALMVTLLAHLAPFVLWAPEIVWKLFDAGFVAPIQAFIFSLLTILYYQSAMAEEGAH